MRRTPNWIDAFERIPLEPTETLEERCTTFFEEFAAYDTRYRLFIVDACIHVIIRVPVIVPMRCKTRTVVPDAIMRRLGATPQQVQVTDNRDGTATLVRRD